MVLNLKTVDDYINADLVHSIHTTQRRSFRGCRRRHNWIFIDGYYPMTTPKPLEFGIAYHKAMEVWYDPDMWGIDRDASEALAIQTFRRTCEGQLKEYLEKTQQTVADHETQEDYDGRIVLGTRMLKEYAKVSRQLDENFRPLFVEKKFEVPIKGPNGETIWCKCARCLSRWMATNPQGWDTQAWSSLGEYEKAWQGLPVTYGGRVDMLAEDILGRYWIFDWKHLSLSMNLLTPAGWTTMGEIQAGDEVIGANGQPTKVVAVSNVVEKEVWEVVFSDGATIECSDEHLWKVHSSQFGWDRVLRTDQLTKAYERYTVDPVGAPIEFNLKPELPMHPYVLGSLLGDGHFGSNRLAFSSQSGETVNLLRQYTNDGTEFHDERKYGGNKWSITGPWKELLARLDLWGKRSAEKFIPQEYLFSSVEDRILLLQGLCDTDGSTGLFRFSTTGGRLAENFRHLVWSLGGTADLSTAKARKHTNKTTDNVEEYFVNYTLPEGIEPNQLERKRVGRPTRTKKTRRRIKEVRRTGRMEPMKCIYVDSPEHLYVTNNFVLTHNTAARLSTGEPGAPDDYLYLDDQISSYCWAFMVQMNIDVAGFVYHEQKKAFPVEPEPLARPRLGRMYSTNKQMDCDWRTYETTVAENDPDGFGRGLYDEFIDYLREFGGVFHKRHQIPRSYTELVNIGLNIYDEACDIIDPNTRIYPAPGRFACSFCAYQDPCLGMNRGDDYTYTLETMFEKRERHYYQEPSTDKPGRG